MAQWAQWRVFGAPLLAALGFQLWNPKPQQLNVVGLV